MTERTAEDNPFHANAPEALADSSISRRTPRDLSLTGMFVVAQAVVLIIMSVVHWMAPAFGLPYAFILVFYARAVERSILEPARAKRWRAARSRRVAWLLCVIAAAGAWPFVDLLKGPRPTAGETSAIVALATVAPIFAGMRTWAKDARTLRADLWAFGPLLAQSILAGLVVGVEVATIAAPLTYWVIVPLSLAGPLVPVVVLASAYLVVHYARRVPSTPAAYRTAAWLASVVAAVHAVRAVFPREAESWVIAPVLVALALGLWLTAARKDRHRAFVVGAIALVGLVPLSEHWLDTVAFAGTAAVVAAGPLLRIARRRGTEGGRDAKT